MRKLKHAVLAAVAAVSALVGNVALATVPAGVETVFTTTATDFGTIVGYGWTLFLTIVGGLLLFKIARKVFGKAS